MKKFIICTDGGSRGNPGPSAIGVVFYNEKEEILKRCSQCLGKATNNQAEYQAVIFALKKFKALFGKATAQSAEIEMRSDSELLVNQLNAKYKILDEKIQPLFLEIWNLRIDFKKIEFIHIPRERNKEADKLVNEALDNEGNAQSLF
ncbi:ribonuclease HI family protein [Candidatus Parcubacteria bacterium]|nr:ribonuclease HI family protein [Candidatus Parcubacteria bacterium]